MRDMQTSAAFVVGNGRKLLGVVHDRDVLKHVKAGNRDLMTIVRNEGILDILERGQHCLPVARRETEPTVISLADSSRIVDLETR